MNLEVPGFSSGYVYVSEHDLPLALRIIENKELLRSPPASSRWSTRIWCLSISARNLFKAAEVAAHLAAQKGARLKFLYSYIDPYVDGNVQLTDTPKL